MDAGRGIGGAGATGDEADAGPARHLADRFGHDGSRAFVATNGEFDIAAVKGIERGKITFARHAERVPHALNR